MPKKPSKRGRSVPPPPNDDPLVPAGSWPAGGMVASEQAFAKMDRFLAGQEFSSIEEMNAALQRFVTAGQFTDLPPLTPLDQAQELIWQAAEAAPRDRLRLTQQALAICPDCADAYTMQAELAPSLPAARDLYLAAVAAAERALEPDIFTTHAGHFWGVTQTRPYMRARAGLAQVLWLLGERAAAIAHYQDLIRLNPHDNQGLRYDLARWLMLTNDTAGFTALMDQYDDAGADWLYTKALWLFRTKARAKATRALKEALAANGFVPAYLLGAKALPRTMPAYVGMGDANEAISYVAAAMEEWDTTPGAIEWLVKGMALALAEAATRDRRDWYGR
jgi:tetratricopeptide (TPR) repeat protein